MHESLGLNHLMWSSYLWEYSGNEGGNNVYSHTVLKPSKWMFDFPEQFSLGIEYFDGAVLCAYE